MPIWRGVIERVENSNRVYSDQQVKLNTYFANFLAEIEIKQDNLGT